MDKREPLEEGRNVLDIIRYVQEPLPLMRVQQSVQCHKGYTYIH